MSEPLSASQGALDPNPMASLPDPGENVGRVCIPNIDTAGRRQRLAAGVVELVVGLGLLGVLLSLHANALWRLPLLLVFWASAIGFFQWRDRT